MFCTGNKSLIYVIMKILFNSIPNRTSRILYVYDPYFFIHAKVQKNALEESNDSNHEAINLINA